MNAHCAHCGGILFPIIYLGSQIYCVKQVSSLPHNIATHKVIQQMPKDDPDYIRGIMLAPRDMEKPMTWSWTSGRNRASIITTTNSVTSMNSSWSNILWEPRRENAPSVHAPSMQ